MIDFVINHLKIQETKTAVFAKTNQTIKEEIKEFFTQDQINYYQCTKLAQLTSLSYFCSLWQISQLRNFFTVLDAQYISIDNSSKR